MTRLLLVVARALWAFYVLSVLLLGLNGSRNGPASDAEYVFLVAMMAVSFPIGLTYSAAFALFDRFRRGAGFESLPSSMVSITVHWLVLSAMSYAQWFVLLPRVIRWFRGAGSAGPAD